MTERAEDRIYPRTEYEARMDVLYSTFLWGLHKRFYERASSALAILSLVLASSAVATAIKDFAVQTSIIGVFLAALAIFNHVWSPRVKAMEVDLARKRWLELLAKVPTLTLEEIDRRGAELEMQDPSPIEAFRKIAYNMGVESEGRSSYVEPLNQIEKVAKIFA